MSAGWSGGESRGVMCGRGGTGFTSGGLHLKSNSKPDQSGVRVSETGPLKAGGHKVAEGE